MIGDLLSLIFVILPTPPGLLIPGHVLASTVTVVCCPHKHTGGLAFPLAFCSCNRHNYIGTYVYIYAVSFSSSRHIDGGDDSMALRRCI